MKILIRLFLILIVTSFFACTKKKNDELVLGFNPAESVDVVEANGKELAKIILDKTGLKLKTFVASDFGALVEAMRSGRVHLGFLPPFSFIQAEKVAGAKVLLKSVRRGHAVFYSAIITAKDYKTLDDLKGKTMAWTDPSSSSGHIIAKSSLMDMGIDPDTYFSKQIFAGGHDALVLAVANKTVDAGATFVNDKEATDGAWHQFLKPEERDKIKVLYISPPIPGDTLSTTEKFYSENKEVVDKVTAVLLELGNTENGRKILKELYRIDSMVVASPDDYIPLRQAAQRLKIF